MTEEQERAFIAWIAQTTRTLCELADRADMATWKDEQTCAAMQRKWDAR